MPPDPLRADAPPQVVGIVTLPGFNEIDSFVAAKMIGSVPGLAVELVGPETTAVSAAGVEVFTPGCWSSISSYAAVLFGSGTQTFAHIENETMMNEIRRGIEASSDAALIGSQCSGAAIAHRLGLLTGTRVCKDRVTAPRLETEGIEVVVGAFLETGRVGTAGGCLSSVYLAFWVINVLAGRAAADLALRKVMPVGEEDEYQRRVARIFPREKD